MKTSEKVEGTSKMGAIDRVMAGEKENGEQSQKENAQQKQL